MRKDLLRAILVSESRAYGFTIAFWGSGILLIDRYGMPGLPEILSYGIGAVLGFGLLTLWAYRGTFKTVESQDTQYLVFGMVHYLAAIAPVLATYFLSSLEPSILGFALSGAAVSIFYNLAMLVEEFISEEARMLEKKMDSVV